MKIYELQDQPPVDPNSINFQVRKCKTSTYQQTYTIRTTRIWNILPGSINDKSNSLITFKNLLIKYYYTALDRNYDVDDPCVVENNLPEM